MVLNTADTGADSSPHVVPAPAAAPVAATCGASATLIPALASVTDEVLEDGTAEFTPKVYVRYSL